jgi:DnaK suppressor protein
MRLREVTRLVKILTERKEQIERNIIGVINETASATQAETNDEVDVATISLGALTDAAIGEQQVKELREIEHALTKVNQGSFGTCEMCGEPIGLERMRVKPHARYCIVCREAYEKNSNGGFARSQSRANG